MGNLNDYNNAIFLSAGNLNADSNIDIFDILLLVNIILNVN